MNAGPDRFRFMSIQTLMNKDVYCIHSSERIMDVWLALMEREISGAPVIDDDEKIIGVMSITDINRAIVAKVKEARALKAASEVHDVEARETVLMDMAESLSIVSNQLVSSIMREGSEVHIIGPNDSLDRALRIMSEKNVNRLPVVRDMRVMGIVTRQDIIDAFAGKKR